MSFCTILLHISLNFIEAAHMVHTIINTKSALLYSGDFWAYLSDFNDYYRWEGKKEVRPYAVVNTRTYPFDVGYTAIWGSIASSLLKYSNLYKNTFDL